LAQIGGLGTLLGSGFSTDKGWGNKLFGKIGNLFDANPMVNFGGSGSGTFGEGDY
jgi:hypothetical protein